MNNENRMNNLKDLNAFNRNIYLKKKAFFRVQKMYNYHLCHNLLLCMHIFIYFYIKCHELHVYEGNSWQKLGRLNF